MNSPAAPRRRQIRAWLVAAVMALTTGCGQSDQPELVPVTGRITLDGEPLADALVAFQSETGRGSRGTTRSDGSYELTYLRNMTGVRPGKHRIYVSTAIEGRALERVPKKYNKHSTLTATVPDAGGNFDFALETK